MTKHMPQIAENDTGEAEEALMSNADIRGLQADLAKIQKQLKKSSDNIETLEDKIDGQSNEVDGLRETNKLIQARLAIRDAEVNGLRTAANVSGSIALVAGTGLLIALLMLI